MTTHTWPRNLPNPPHRSLASSQSQAYDPLILSAVSQPFAPEGFVEQKLHMQRAISSQQYVQAYGGEVGTAMALNHRN